MASAHMLRDQVRAQCTTTRSACLTTHDLYTTPGSDQRAGGGWSSLSCEDDLGSGVSNPGAVAIGDDHNG